MVTVKKYKKLVNKELSNITASGKAMNTLAGAFTGATTGVKYCTPGGPWAMAGCGLVGGLVGGVIGYNAP